MADIPQINANIAKVTAWYKQKPLYAGMVIGAIAMHFLRHFLA